MKNILTVQELNKSFVINNSLQNKILKDINLEVKESEFISIMGPSGSGKSTLLYCMSAMDTITSGRIVFAGQEISKFNETKLSQLRLENIGFVFQQSHLLKNLSLFDNIVLPAYLAQKNSRKNINIRAYELMEKLNIVHLKDHDITQASGGQLQRVAICRALICQPKIIFGDEPTGALNSQAATEVMHALIDIHNLGTTIVLATHDVKIAARTERILFMRDGMIIDQKYLGKAIAQESSYKEREEILLQWLSKNGF